LFWLETVSSILILWLALVLVVPKRDCRTIPARLRATAAGERYYLFGPPDLRRWGKGDFWDRLSAEVPRCLELGVPLWLVALKVEELSRRRRIECEAAWANSPLGWMWRHLNGELSEAELHQLYEWRGLPLPAPKAQVPRLPVYSMPPMSWLRERKVDLANGDLEWWKAFSDDEDGGGRIKVRTLGEFQVLSPNGIDLTPELRRRPVACYIWQYSLVRAILESERGIPRNGIADELYPGIDVKEQLKRLRQRLHDFQRRLPPEFGKAMMIGERELRFNLKKCLVDTVEVLQLAAAVRAGRSSALDPKQDARLKAAASAAATEFLPDWLDLQQDVNEGRGGAEEYIQTIRIQVQSACTTLGTQSGHQM
jgi:hypothetical protein